MLENDGLPGQVCLQCVHYINRAFSFKQLCERSDSTLRQLLGRPIENFLELKPVSTTEYMVTNTEVETIASEISNFITEAKSPEDDDLSKFESAPDNEEIYSKLRTTLCCFII